jgi:hypothetical protein
MLVRRRKDTFMNYHNGNDLNAQDQDAIRLERRALFTLLADCIDAMRTTQRIFWLSDEHILVTRCKEIEKWLDAHDDSRSEVI